MITNLTPVQVAEHLKAGDVTLIDVRELHEHRGERIEGALHMPLSSFNPASVPIHPKKTVVFHCARGGRSANAVSLCQKAGLKIDAHLAGGIAAWTSAGLPTLRAPRKPGLLARLFGG
ncbi:MAG: rhodanese-like domain-containing protein [Acetobacteraceae bacterium]|nr:rhodanese-like domain-containing protein [Acetobacteraceae bacterium]